jgi:hypothetical protein
MAKRGRSHRRSHQRDLPQVRGVDDAAQIVKQLVCDEHTQGQLVVGLDASQRVAGAVFNCPCDACNDKVLRDPEELIDLADAMQVDELFLVTFVSDERLAPTAADVARFEGLRIECLDDDVLLLDHLLFSGHRWRSVAEVSLSADPDASTSW